MDVNKTAWDRANTSVIALTFILFVAALFTKGFTHDLLLEAGVFLVSVKLILGVKLISLEQKRLHQKIDQLIDLNKK